MERLGLLQYGIVLGHEQCEARPTRTHVVQLRTEAFSVDIWRNEEDVFDFGPYPARYRSRAPRLEGEEAPHGMTQDRHFLDVRCGSAESSQTRVIGLEAIARRCGLRNTVVNRASKVDPSPLAGSIS